MKFLMWGLIYALCPLALAYTNWETDPGIVDGTSIQERFERDLAADRSYFADQMRMFTRSFKDLGYRWSKASLKIKWPEKESVCPEKQDCLELEYRYSVELTKSGEIRLMILDGTIQIKKSNKSYMQQEMQSVELICLKGDCP